MKGLGALIFDVFGTCVDWRNSVARDVAAQMPTVDAFAFADAWRGEYQPSMDKIRNGRRGYIALDDLHRENLDIVLDRLGVKCADPAYLSTAWERLDPWQDTVPGLLKMQRTHIIAPCSNGSIGLMTRLARYGGLPWDCILGAEIAQTYKPEPSVYLAACAALRLAPDRVMMVASHNGDLRAARSRGLRTAFVPRITEHGPHQSTDLTPSETWDIAATDMVHLAQRLT